MRVRTNPVRIFFHGAGWPLAPFRAEGCLEIREARAPSEVVPLLIWARESSERGRMAAGFLAYEAAAAFGLPVRDGGTSSIPLGWFAAFDPGEAVPPGLDRPANAEIPEPVFDTGRDEYFARIALIRERIAAGDTYQVNFTTRARFDWTGDPMDLFARLCLAHPVPYACAIDAGAWSVASLSPELFLEKRGGGILTIPMKGTRPRGRFPGEDGRTARELTESGKDRAENVMIVDMIRNDMGRVAKIGSVRVPALFSVERYPTVLQMTSTVEARTDASLTEIMAHMFPCASITGAPKVRTMAIIRELEPQPRGVYCGAIGVIQPGRKVQFNVAIRTVVVDRQRQQAIYGVGSGVVWDSDAADEYAECRTKTRVLTEKRPSFQLLETMLWQPDGGIFLRDEHLTRLTASAQYFNIPLDLAAMKQALHPPPATRHPHKIRLLVAQDGRFTVETTPLADEALPDVVRVGLAQTPVHSSNIWLYHKTTQRQVYAAARAERPDCDDVILVNERGELTEATIANIVLDLDGELVTPPVTAGLLAGTMRDCLVKNGRLRAQTLTPADLRRCRQIYLINSVRKWRKATLIETSTS